MFVVVAAALVGASTVAPEAVADDTGGLVYAQQCVSCHGPKLGGNSFGPALKGDAFFQKWRAKGSKDLLTYVAQTMPPANPMGLSPQEYSSVSNYVLAQNHLPSLTDHSTGDAAGLVNVPLENQSMYAIKTDKDYIDGTYRDIVATRAELTARVKPVTEQTLLKPPDSDWLHWRRVYDATGYSPLAQINRENVTELEVAWSLSLPVGTNGITPIVHDGLMFVNSHGTVTAIDAVTGDVLWKFVRPATAAAAVTPPVTQPKSMAIWGNALYVPTIDNHMIALDFRTGAVLWDHTIEGTDEPLKATAGPLIVRGKVIQGMAGCGGTLRAGGCFIVALDAKTGRELWRVNTLARPGEPGGDTWNGAPLAKRQGGSIWTTGSYDQKLNLVYFGVGQTYHIGPLLDPKPPKSGADDALYTNATLALNPDTGKLVWHFQHLSREVWDLDWAFERILLTAPTAKGPVRAVATMGKLGILDVLNARTGKYLFSYDLGLQNLVTHIDPHTGAKTVDPAFEPSETLSEKLLCPFPNGVRNFYATSYDPTRSRLYVPANASCTRYRWRRGEDIDIYFDGLLPMPGRDGNYGQFVSIDLEARKPRWTHYRRAPQTSAVLATGGGLVFLGSRDRWFQAYDGDTGKVLWQTRLNEIVSAFPITFAKDGVQYVAVIAGEGGPSNSAWAPTTPELPATGASSTTLWVFKLRGAAQ